MTIKLGDKVRDTVSGLEGIATSRCTYLNGCDHIGIQSPAKDGKIPPIQWVDEPQVEVVEENKRPSSEGWKGGPAQHPGQKAHAWGKHTDDSDDWRNG